MPFQKGHKGYLTPEQQANMDRSHMQTPEYREKMRQIALQRGYGKWMKGKKQTEETKKKKSESQLGHKRGGWKLSPQTRKKMGASRRGSKSSFWRGGVTPKNTLIRTSVRYKLWREAVFKRDNFTCRHCGQRGGKLHADHIMPFALYPDMRFDISNGRTLCIPCHKATPTFLKSGRKLVEAAYPGTKVKVVR